MKRHPLFSLLLLPLALAFTACETSSAGGSEKAITLDPASVTLDGDGLSTVFTASSSAEDTELALPLEWSVSNAALGTFISTGGLSAVYQSTSLLGSNAITVKDQSGAEGVALVYQGFEESLSETSDEESAE
ncbi:hypothetical protein P0Y35_18595 [Kiritimatiellaeota bacterium B1221]|nr:hypothetical protein [Kiritimatiellaeota bacterium B1221]